jgi:hypothetical protein
LRRGGPGGDAGQVDDYGDVPVAAPGVPPDVFVEPDDGDTVEPGRIVDQRSPPSARTASFAVDQDTLSPFGDPGHSQVLTHQPFQRPPQPAPGQFRLRLGGLRRVLSPHMPTTRTPATADRDQQNLGRQPNGSCANAGSSCRGRRPRSRTGDANDRARRHGSAAKKVASTNVWVFQMGSVKTSIIGRPRRLSREQRATPNHTVICGAGHRLLGQHVGQPKIPTTWSTRWSPSSTSSSGPSRQSERTPSRRSSRCPSPHSGQARLS